jgi:hypothetical protein
MLHSKMRSSKPRSPGEMRANPILCLQVGHDGRSAMADEIRITLQPRILTVATQRILVRSGKSYSVGAGRGCQMSGIAGKKIGVRRPSGFVLSLPAHRPGRQLHGRPLNCRAPKYGKLLALIGGRQMGGPFFVAGRLSRKRSSNLVSGQILTARCRPSSTSCRFPLRSSF